MVLIGCSGIIVKSHYSPLANNIEILRMKIAGDDGLKAVVAEFDRVKCNRTREVAKPVASDVATMNLKADLYDRTVLGHD
jgi:hypothetical protein